MKKILLWSLLTVLSCHPLMSMASTGTCNLPVGKYTGHSIMIQDKSTGNIEQFVIELNVRSNHKISGKIRLYDLSSTSDSSLKKSLKKNHFFELKNCNQSRSTYTVSSPDLDGVIKIDDFNKKLNEITITGAIDSYEDGLYGWGQWLYDAASKALDGDTYPEIDFRKIPIRLRQEL